jgi:hypothetical protein
MATRKNTTNTIASKAAASMLTGAEPAYGKLEGESASYKEEIQVVFNWYSAEKKRSDAYKYYLDYVKKFRNKDYKLFQKVDEGSITTTLGWIARIIIRGGSVSNDHTKRLEDNITQLLSKFTEEKKIQPEVTKQSIVPSINIQEATKLKAKEYIGDLEGSIDEYIFDDKDFSLYADLKGKQIPAPYVPDVKVWAESKLSEYSSVADGEDSQLIEGYSNINKRKLKNIVKLFETFIEDCDKYGQFKKANRKVQAVREKPPAIQVKSVKYKMKDEELKLESERPIDIIGAAQVWLFNTKTRKLAVYTSESTKGMTVKGSTLQNWTPEKSKQKTLRKPDEQLKDLLASGKVKLRTFIDSIKSKEQEVNGRINIETIILKVVR